MAVRKLAAMVYFLGGWALTGSPASAEILTAERIAELESCGATVTLRESETEIGRLYGALFSPSDGDAAPAEQPYSRGIAVIIGVSKFAPGSGLADLPGVHKDVEAMSRLLLAKDGSDLGYDVLVRLEDENATGDNVLCLMENALRDEMRETDRLFFYWAGHGIDRKAGATREGYLAFHDTKRKTLNRRTALPMSTIEDWSADPGFFLNVRQAVFVLDACFSGLATRVTRSERSAEPLASSRDVGDYGKFLRSYTRIGKPAHVILAAADSDNPTREGPEGGFFTQQLTEFLSGKVTPEDNGEGVWNQYVLMQHLTTRMLQMDNPGRPQMQFVSGAYTDQQHRSQNREPDMFFLSTGSPLISRFADLRRANEEKLEAARQKGASEAAAQIPGDTSQKTATGPSGGDVFAGASKLVESCSRDSDINLADASVVALGRNEMRCSIALEVKPDSSALLISRALIRRELGKRLRESDPDSSNQSFADAAADFRSAKDMPGGVLAGLNLANMIWQGDGFERSDANDKEMAKLALEAVERGQPDWGPNFYGWLLWAGRGVEKDPIAAAGYFEEAAAAGYSLAAYNLGDLLSDASFPKPDMEKAKAAYLRAAELGRASGHVRVSQMLTEGLLGGVSPENDKLAFEQVQLGLKLEPNSGWGLHMMGWMNETGRGVAQDFAKAIAYYEQGDKVGYTDSTTNWGRLKRSGSGTEKDFAGAVTLFEKSCNLDLARGCAELADILVDESGSLGGDAALKKSGIAIDKAFRLDPRDTFTISLRAHMLLNGLGLEKDEKAAAEAFRQAGELGYGFAWRRYAYMLAEGYAGLPGDPAGSIAAFEKGAAAGDAWSITELVDRKLSGNGFERNAQTRAEAVALAEQAAKAGNAAGLVKLGLALEEDDPADFAGAMALYKRGYDMGDQDSACKLGDLVRDHELPAEAFIKAKIPAHFELYKFCNAPIALARALYEIPETTEDKKEHFVRPAPQDALNMAYAAYVSALDNDNTRNEGTLALAAFGLAALDGQQKAALPAGNEITAAKAVDMLKGVDPAAEPQSVVGLAVASLLSGEDVTTLAALSAAVASDAHRCEYKDSVLANSETPIFPPFDCGWSAAKWPFWTIGLATTNTKVNLRKTPGNGLKIDLLPAGSPVAYMPLANSVGVDWVKVMDANGRMGWVQAKYLKSADAAKLAASLQ